MRLLKSSLVLLKVIDTFRQIIHTDRTKLKIYSSAQYRQLRNKYLKTVFNRHQVSRIFFMSRQPPVGRGFATIGGTSLDKWSTPRRDFYLRTHNTDKRQTPMPLAGFETAIPATERPWTHALDLEGTRIGKCPPYLTVERDRIHHIL
jgi:hypothetical protein